MAYRYVANNAAVKALRTEPCSSATDSNLTNAVTDAENKVDLYLASRDIAVPLTGLEITGDIGEAVAVYACAKLYHDYGFDVKASELEREAETILNRVRKSVDVDISASELEPEISNYQREYVDDFNEPNDTAENMDE